MFHRSGRFGRVALLVSLLAVIAASRADAQWRNFTVGQYGFSMSVPADWTIDQPTTDIIAIYDLPLLDYWRLQEPGLTMEIAVYFLDNSGLLPLASFLTIPREGSTTVLPRRIDTVGGLPVLRVGYEYDPPAWDIIEAEHLHMIERTPSLFVYLQFVSVVGVDYTTLLDQIIGTVDATVDSRVTTFGQIKKLYR